MSMECIKVIIRYHSLIYDYQVDHFAKKSTFWSKWTAEISQVTPPDSDNK